MVPDWRQILIVVKLLCYLFLGCYVFGQCSSMHVILMYFLASAILVSPSVYGFACNVYVLSCYFTG